MWLEKKENDFDFEVWEVATFCRNSFIIGERKMCLEVLTRFWTVCCRGCQPDKKPGQFVAVWLEPGQFVAVWLSVGLCNLRTQFRTWLYLKRAGSPGSDDFHREVPGYQVVDYQKPYKTQCLASVLFQVQIIYGVVSLGTWVFTTFRAVSPSFKSTIPVVYKYLELGRSFTISGAYCRLGFAVLLHHLVRGTDRGVGVHLHGPKGPWTETTLLYFYSDDCMVAERHEVPRTAMLFVYFSFSDVSLTFFVLRVVPVSLLLFFLSRLFMHEFCFHPA